VALDVGLVDHVETELVAERIPLAHVRIVAGADGVDVVLLHQADVLKHPLARHDLPEIGIPLVAVHTANEHWLAVDEKLPVARLARAEADAPGDHLERLARVVLEREQQRVKMRCLSGPFKRARDLARKV